MIKAIFFDLDDTLIDAFSSHRKANELVFQDYNIPYHVVKEKTKGQDFTGLRVKDMLKIKRDSLGLGEKDIPLNELVSKREKYFLKLVKERATIYPGAKSALIKSKRGGKVVAIVSSGTRKYIEVVLRKFDIFKYIDYIIGSEDVEKGKPNPECYINAHKLLSKKSKIEKNQVLVVEDSIHGINAAIGAGLKTLLVSDKPNAQKVEADYTITSLEKFDLNLFV